MNKIQGLIAAPFTPFKADGKLNLPVVDQQVEMLLANGVQGAFVGGTTGEAMSLTIEERKLLAQKWADACPAGFKVIIQCGHTTLASCKEMAKHAQEIGSYGVGAMGPFFYKPASIEDLVAFTKEIALVIPELPFYYYHMPSMTGIDLPMIDYLEAGSEIIPNLAGIKYTHEDLVDFKLCIEYQNGKFDMLYGRDETLLCGLALGAKAAIGSTYNYKASIYNQIIAAWNEKDIVLANDLQYQVMKFIRILIKYGGGIIAGKAIMKLMGIDCGPLRAPLRSLSDKELLSLEQELEEIGFFQFSKKV